MEPLSGLNPREVRMLGNTTLKENFHQYKQSISEALNTRSKRFGFTPERSVYALVTGTSEKLLHAPWWRCQQSY